MTSFASVESVVLELPETQRATLALHLLRSLPAMLSEPDQGLAEARRRDAELDADPSMALSLAEFDRQIVGRKRH